MMQFYKKPIALFCLGLLFAGCGTYFNQPVVQQEARTGELTPKSRILENLPMPAEPVVVGVYNFKDQTGQYKAVDNGSTFSTAVSQGSTTMLIKALEDSKWFTPIERENINNLINERNIIRSTRDEYRKNKNPNEPSLPPLLYAGILLEGGVVSYDSNIVTGGLGARYFGISANTQYREDRLTVYLRAVSTKSGRILKTVYVSKTILSQSVNASLFKFVDFQRLLEVETGFTKNEPVQLALKGAIEKAVEALIIEGIEDRIWSSKEGTKMNDKLIEDYKKQKEKEESMRLYDRVLDEAPRKMSFDVSFGSTLFDGDLSKKEFGSMASLGLTKKLTNNLSISGNAKYLNLQGGNTFDVDYYSADLNLEYDLLPSDNFGPYLYAGGGYIFGDEISTAKFQYGLAVVYKMSDRLGLRVFAEQNLTFSDELDNAINGKRDDFYYNFGFGIKYYLSGKSKRKNEEGLELIEDKQ
ncbi:MAG: curli production assembly/transport component CsgG [Flavobacteriales bacterium]|jgi:curli production assembly/transport component CsgG